MGTEIIFQVLLVAAAGAFIGLDRTAAGQFMFSQPIVAGPLVGWLLGDVTTGLVIGVILELIWLMDMPVGTFVPADSTVAAVWAAASCIIGSAGQVHTYEMGFSLLLTIGIVPVTMKADAIVRKKNAMLADFISSARSDRAEGRLRAAHVLGLLGFFLKSLIIYIIFIPIGVFAVHWFGRAPQRIHSAMSMFLYILPLLGVASAARRLSVAWLDRFIFSGFLIASVSAQAFGAGPVLIIACAVAAGWLGVRYYVK